MSAPEQGHGGLQAGCSGAVTDTVLPCAWGCAARDRIADALPEIRAGLDAAEAGAPLWQIIGPLQRAIAHLADKTPVAEGGRS